MDQTNKNKKLNRSSESTETVRGPTSTVSKAEMTKNLIIAGSVIGGVIILIVLIILIKKYGKLKNDD